MDVDSGAELDYDLTKAEKDEAGNETVDYSGMYDLDDICSSTPRSISSTGLVRPIRLPTETRPES